MMWAVKFTLCTVFCLNITTRPTSASVYNMETLLGKPFWTELTRKFPNAQIYGIDQQTVSVSELFSPLSDGTIVNESNFFDKVRQYHNLLLIVFSDVLSWHLTYFMELKRFYFRTNSSWHLYLLTWSLISSSRIIYSPMKYALSFVRRMYRENWGLPSDLPPLGKQLHRDLKYLLSLRNRPIHGLLRKLDEMMIRWQKFLSNYRDIVCWRNTMSDIYEITGNVVQVVARDNNDQSRLSLSANFLFNKHERFVDEFKQIGFMYHNTTEETIFQ